MHMISSGSIFHALSKSLFSHLLPCEREFNRKAEIISNFARKGRGFVRERGLIELLWYLNFDLAF